MELIYDGKIDLAVGTSRHTKHWKNKAADWSGIVDKLSKTHRTHEKYSEYLSSPKARQDEIKDRGGFVGGYLTGGRRKAGSVLHRQLVTLDLDFATAQAWDDFIDTYACAACVYSTHKHSPEAPRLRLVLPLDREVSSDEYQAISRRIASTLGIEQFDPTTYQPERLMYWPSTSADGEFYFRHQDGPWLSADAVLATYTDWTDTSEWPMGEKEQEIVKRGVDKQDDPTEKKGVVGAFCRTYTVTEAIELFLSDVYAPTDQPDRFSYLKGSTAGGLIVYEDKFAYSHHGTDPVSGKLCNAFDLVRLHKFGIRDEDSRADTPTHKLPSQQAMEKLATDDKNVKQTIGADMVSKAFADFGDEDDTLSGDPDGASDSAPTESTANDDKSVAGTAADLSWMKELEINTKGEYESTINNYVLILTNDPALRDNLKFDDFEGRPIFRRSVPWRKVDHKTRFLTDRDIDIIEHRVETVYGLANRNKMDRALSFVYEANKVHPVRDYLNGLTWDKRPRLDRVFIDYMGCADTAYTRAVSRKSLTAAVARIFKPGIKFDYVLTLVGTKQGQKKSTLLDRLGRGWFSDTFNFHMILSKEGYESLRGVWLIEIAEMGGITKAEIERVKGFLSARKDRYRSAYGRLPEDRYRQCVFFGTTNKTDFLRDQTGNRRFWPLVVNKENASKDVTADLTDYEVGQVWAEAVHRYKQGEPLYLNDELEAEAAGVQDAHTEDHPWTEIIVNYLETPVPEDWAKRSHWDRIEWLQNGPSEDESVKTVERSRVCVAEIWKEALNERGTIDEKGASTIRAILRKIGWVESKVPARFGFYGQQRGGFLRPESSDVL